MVSRKENKMNLLQRLWAWLSSLFKQAPAPPISEVREQVAEPLPASPSVGEILREVLLGEGIGGNVLDKHNIVSHFEEWYQGECDPTEIRNSISEFRKAMGGAINAKLNGVK
jgi:hypothetical protein